MKLLRPLLCLIFLFACGVAHGQDAAAVAPADSGIATRILVIGDALSGGLGAGLTRMTEATPQFDVTFRVNEASGLARPEIYDWAATLPNLLEGQGYKIVVVMAGSNDRRDILDGDKTHAFGSAEWTAAYRRNVDRLIDSVITAGASVVWAGQPPMADPAYDSAMQLVSKIQKEQVEAKGGVFVDFHAPLLGPDGRYSDMGNDDTGTLRKLRSRDGITFYKQGNNRLAQIVLGAISAAEADKQVEPQPDQSAALPSLPIFGEPGEGGVDRIYDTAKLAEALKLAPADEAATSVDPPAAKPSIAQAGSSADRFFATGLSDPAPAGRFDDFGVGAESQSQ